MVSLRERCEVLVLRNTVDLGEWSQCTQGRNLEYRHTVFSNSTAEENRCSGDLSRVIASFANVYKATRDDCFGKYVALCGNNVLMRRFLREQVKAGGGIILPFKLCIEGAFGSGSPECLDACESEWENLTRSLSTPSKRACSLWIMSQLFLSYSIRVRLTKLLFRNYDLSEMDAEYMFGLSRICDISPSTFQWISSRWHRDTVIRFLEGLNLKPLVLDRVFNWCCCSPDKSNTHLLMALASSCGALDAFKWLEDTGAHCANAVMIGIVNGNFEVPLFLTSTCKVSMCEKASRRILQFGDEDTLNWCLQNYLFACSSKLIVDCVRRDQPSKLKIVLEGGGVVHQRHITEAANQRCITCLKITCQSGGGPAETPCRELCSVET